MSAGGPHLTRLSLLDFRCYERAELELPPGVTLVVGANAQGKTSLLEAAAWAATGGSFRGVPDAALVRAGCDAAIVRAEVVDGARTQLLEAEIRAAGRNRVRLNGHPLTRARDRRELMRVTAFAPDDLQLVKGGPAGRRAYLDDLLVSVAPRYEAVVSEYDRVLRQRNALLKQRFGTDPDDETTLRVFDTQLARTGAELARGRARMLERLVPLVAAAHDDLAGSETTAVDAEYDAEWWVPDAVGVETAPSLAAAGPDDVVTALYDALASRRRAELDRKVTLVGPHRDEWRLRVRGLDARTHASQGEQRTLALALRLGGHRLCTDVTGSAPVLLLDDVFSELDATRSSALVAHLVAGQTLLTTAGEVPAGVRAEHMLQVDAGVVRGGRLRGDGDVDRDDDMHDQQYAAPAFRAGADPREDGFTSVGDALERVRDELGLPAPSAIDVLRDRWADIVGGDIAVHARLVGVRDGVATVTADGPLWATQLRYLETAIVAGVAAAIGDGVVTSVRVRVGT